MADGVRIGREPPPAPPPHSGKLAALLAAIVLAVGAGAWLVGTSRDPSSPTTTTVLPNQTTTTTLGLPTTTMADRVPRAVAFWTALGTGDAAAARRAVPAPTDAALDLIAFVAAFSPGLQATECREFNTQAVQCLVTVTDQELLTIGKVGGTQRLLLSTDGRFDLPAALASAAARLSLHALTVHPDDVRAACPLTDRPPVPDLAIVGSPTAACGTYLAGLVPEYLAGGATAGLP